MHAVVMLAGALHLAATNASTQTISYVALLPVITALINFATGTALPSLTALITHKLAPSWYKGIILLVLSAGAGALTQTTTSNVGFDWRGFLLSWGQTFFVGVVMHNGLTGAGANGGLNGALQRVFPGGLGRDAGKLPASSAAAPGSAAVMDRPKA